MDNLSVYQRYNNLRHGGSFEILGCHGDKRFAKVKKKGSNFNISCNHSNQCQSPKLAKQYLRDICHAKGFKLHVTYLSYFYCAKGL